MVIEYRCPKCGSTNLTVSVDVTFIAPLIQGDGDFPRVPRVKDYSAEELDVFGLWDDNSEMGCEACGHFDEARKFKLGAFLKP